MHAAQFQQPHNSCSRAEWEELVFNDGKQLRTREDKLMRPAARYGDDCVSHWELKNKNNISGEKKAPHIWRCYKWPDFLMLSWCEKLCIHTVQEVDFLLDILFSVNHCQCPFPLLMVPCIKYCTWMRHISRITYSETASHASRGAAG